MSMSETFDTMISYVAENAVPLAIAFVAGAGAYYAYDKIVVDDNGNVKKIEAPKKEEPKKEEGKEKSEKAPISKKELKKELKKLLEEADEKGVDVKKILNED